MCVIYIISLQDDLIEEGIPLTEEDPHVDDDPNEIEVNESKAITDHSPALTLQKVKRLDIYFGVEQNTKSH